eukprot:1156497-Pelagomonas_calceolata.AAC.1
MRIGRVVGHALRRLDSPSPCIHLRATSDPPPSEAPKTWPTFLQRIVEFDTHKDVPNLSIPAADLALDTY